jgi:hypothetical protein
MRASMMPETALLLASAVSDLPQLERALSDLPGFRPADHTTLTATYYDTTAGRLKRDGLALQVRNQNGQYSQMVVKSVVNGEPPLAHQEWGDVIDGEVQDLPALNGSAHLPEVLSDPELRARFTTVVQRTLFLLEPDASTQIAGALDAGEIRTVEGEHAEPICEVGCGSNAVIQPCSTGRGCVFSKLRPCASSRAARLSVATGFLKTRPPSHRLNTPCRSA